MATASDGTMTTVTTMLKVGSRWTCERARTWSPRSLPNGSGPPTPVPQTVRVDAGAYTQVTLEVDSGIR